RLIRLDEHGTESGVAREMQEEGRDRCREHRDERARFDLGWQVAVRHRAGKVVGAVVHRTVGVRVDMLLGVLRHGSDSRRRGTGTASIAERWRSGRLHGASRHRYASAGLAYESHHDTRGVTD